jgi:hypothetical protein
MHDTRNLNRLASEWNFVSLSTVPSLASRSERILSSIGQQSCGPDKVVVFARSVIVPTSLKLRGFQHDTLAKKEGVVTDKNPSCRLFLNSPDQIR